MKQKATGLTANGQPTANAKGFIFLILGMVVFSGMLAKAEGWIRIFDFTVLLGQFGTILPGSAAGFQGVGGTGARDGFLFALSVLPAGALAMGFITVVEGQGGFAAAQKLLTPVLKPLIGIPGVCGLALIASLQLVDIGAASIRELYEAGKVTQDELTIFTSFIFSAGHLINVYFSVGLVLFPYYPDNIPIFVPLVVVFAAKVLGSNMMRLYLFLEKRLDWNGGTEQ